MSLESLGINLRIKLVLATSWVVENTAKLFGYPKTSSGMPIGNDPNGFNNLPMHDPRVPPAPDPNSIFEAIFGNVPKSSAIEKFYYESPRDGYYNFYIEHYRNVIFLPDWVSKWIQLIFDIGADTSGLEIIRDTLFSLIVYFMFFLQFRMMLYYFITINPYTRPWIYLISLTDWIYDLLFHLGITKRATFFGFPLLSILVNGAVGVLADALNHLVFTMPYLPSEGVTGQILINGTPKDIIMFRYLPQLWWTNPIPDKLREFWHFERPEIQQFMHKNYKMMDSDLLPIRVLRSIYEQQRSHSEAVGLRLFTDYPEKVSAFVNSTFYDSQNWSHELSHYLLDKPEMFISSVVDHMGNII
tara:strand:- start:651 stop:1721 length:1071 start_codon:yes stop_codon:yes gene_type:complete